MKIKRNTWRYVIAWMIISATNTMHAGFYKKLEKYFNTTIAPFLVVLAGTIAHEVGHATVNALLTGDAFHLNLGGDAHKKAIIATNYVTVRGFDPCRGYIHISTEDPLRVLAIVLAGPIAGLLCNYFIYKKIGRHYDSLSAINVANYYSALAVNFGSLIPRYQRNGGPKSDGAWIHECIRVLFEDWNIFAHLKTRWF